MTRHDDYSAVVPAPVGMLGIRMREGRLVGIDFAPATDPPGKAPDEATREVLDQLFHYFEDARWRFDLPLAMGVGSALPDPDRQHPQLRRARPDPG